MPNGKRIRGIRALVVDDEPLSRSNITTLLRLDPEIESVVECGVAIDALAEIRNAKPDLLFLDVEMPEYDGFDILEMLGGDLPLAIVFVTAYDRYALRAFDAGALDYLLKPFGNSRFERALERAKQKIESGRSGPRPSDTIVVKSVGEISFLKISEIDWIEASGYYSRLHLGNKSHLLRRPMADLERELAQSDFCRIHRSTIVKLDRIDGLKINEIGEFDVLLKDGTRLRTSRRYQQRLRLLLSERDSSET